METELSGFFSDIYERNVWGCGSGGGSRIENTHEYNKFIVEFIRQHGITDVVDLGCGDWQSSYLIYNQLSQVKYRGYDCVKSIVEANKVKHSRHSFDVLEFATYPDQIPSGQLCILKDVLQHLENNEIYRILDECVRKFKYILVTNCCGQQMDDEPNSHRSRPLAAQYLPLKKYGATPYLRYFTKEISLIEGCK